MRTGKRFLRVPSYHRPWKDIEETTVGKVNRCLELSLCVGHGERTIGKESGTRSRLDIRRKLAEVNRDTAGGIAVLFHLSLFRIKIVYPVNTL